MSILAPLIMVLALVAAGWVGGSAGWLKVVFGLAVPYAAFAVFTGGVLWRVLSWARSPVPFNITSTSGQQTSLPWIRRNPIENPHTKIWVVVRMALEVFFFRSLFRNVRHEITPRAEGGQPRVAYRSSLWLWLGALAFHYAFLIVLLRHFRFFTDPAPRALTFLETLDGFLQAGSPTIFLSGFLLFGAVGFLLLRRLTLPQVRYISLPADYFPLFLIIAIALTGGLMRYTPLRVDITSVKELSAGLARFSPSVSAGAGVGALFYIHLTLVSALFAYLPFSKLSHMAGVFLSPTRNMIGASRMRRHVNPWNHPVDTHSYEEYEDDFRDKMIKAGIPVDRNGEE